MNLLNNLKHAITRARIARARKAASGELRTHIEGRVEECDARDIYLAYLDWLEREMK